MTKILRHLSSGKLATEQLASLHLLLNTCLVHLQSCENHKCGPLVDCLHIYRLRRMHYEFCLRYVMRWLHQNSTSLCRAVLPGCTRRRNSALSQNSESLRRPVLPKSAGAVLRYLRWRHGRYHQVKQVHTTRDVTAFPYHLSLFLSLWLDVLPLAPPSYLRSS